jgi:hypothetical protein
MTDTWSFIDASKRNIEKIQQENLDFNKQSRKSYETYAE